MIVLPRPTVIAPLKYRAFRAGHMGELVPLPDALELPCALDAHMAAYTATWHGRGVSFRLASADVERPTLRAFMQLAIFDVDAPGHVRTLEWDREFRSKLAALNAAHPGAFAFSTRGGWRLLWWLAAPFPIASREDAGRWRASYRAACDELERRFGIFADRSCADWTRLFRVPRATRDGEAQRPETIGDAHAIGAFDVARFEPAAEPAPSCAPSSPSAAPRRVEPTRRIGERKGAPWWRPALLAALEARGEVMGAREPGVFVVRCPNALEHTTGRDGDGSTLLYASAGAEGRIVCLHSHCAHLDHAAWLEVLGLAGGAAVTRRARIDRWFIGGSGPNMRVRFALSAADDGGPLGVDYLGVTPGASAARWSALWAAASVEPPSDLDPCGDLGAALGELLGRVITVELDASAGRVNPVRRILGA